MAEKLYTIPVNDAFSSDTECPVCTMYKKLEDDSIDFMMGPSYMEDDIRMETDRLGFCKTHMRMLAAEKNRLGLSLILKTHLDRQVKEAEKRAGKPMKAASLLKKPEEAELVRWAREASCDCYICSRIERSFPRYIDTILHLYKKDPEFRKKYESSKGFCQEHLGLLLAAGQRTLPQKELDQFRDTTVRLYIENLKRLSDDLAWFSDKFDYRYKDAPWKNSKDAIERAVIKTNGVMPDKKPENH